MSKVMMKIQKYLKLKAFLMMKLKIKKNTNNFIKQKNKD